MPKSLNVPHPDDPKYNVQDLVRLQQAVLGQRELTPQERDQFGVTGTPTVRDMVDPTKRILGQQGPVPTPASDSPIPQHDRAVFQRTPYQPTMPEPEMMSLDEMMDVIDRRTHLATQPRIDAAERALEEQQLAGERQMGAVQDAYEQARGQRFLQGRTEQQMGARTMDRRGVYDSGMAADLANRISQTAMHQGMQLDQQEASTLADIAEYLSLRERHTMEEIQQIMGEKAEMAQAMLDEMHMAQQDRRDVLAQREFENWLSLQAHELQEDMARLEEYWREEGFDAQQAHRAWDQWFAEEQLRLQEQQAQWDRILSMNRFEAEQELARLAMNNEISQQEFQNAMALDEFDLKRALYEWQSLA